MLRFQRGLMAMHESVAGEARLGSWEPNLLVRATAEGRTGHVEVRVELTPDHMEQGHWFKFGADQSYLPAVISQCDAILARLPVRDGATRGV